MIKEVMSGRKIAVTSGPLMSDSLSNKCGVMVGQSATSAHMISAYLLLRNYYNFDVEWNIEFEQFYSKPSYRAVNLHRF